MNDLKVGDKVWYVANQRHRSAPIEQREMTVTKVARKWVTLDWPNWRPMRIDKETWIADGGGFTSPGRCYASKEAYAEYLLVSAAWTNLVRRMPYLPPPDVDLAWIEAVHRRLGIALPPPPASHIQE